MAEKAKKSEKTGKKSQKVAGDEAIAEDVVTKKAGPQATAKAGRRSAKAVKETEEKVAKEERKKSAAEADTKSQEPTVVIKPARSREERAGRKYREAAKEIDKSKTYNLAEAVDLAAKTSTAKFDATVEMHINLAVDPKQADQNVRDMVSMPHGTGKTSTIAVFAEGDDAEAAKKAGADIAGSDEILSALEKEQIDFDILISTPELMAKLGKYARLLGPKGLMPNPKSGTVTADVSKAVKEAKAGRVEYRVDQSGIIHLGIGKVSFGPQKLLENAQTVAASVRSAKPASVKGAYVKSAYVSSTMGPSIKTEI
ncbi:50S ribosomal protein L1 [Candidatus Saccharibacteria bacterium]|nr:50S ribosomal protein L1 [Candidatus Saccharibacteria bacterium]